jgi:hypothetical protein
MEYYDRKVKERIAIWSLECSLGRTGAMMTLSFKLADLDWTARSESVVVVGLRHCDTVVS